MPGVQSKTTDESSSRSRNAKVFQNEGKYWTIIYSGTLFRLRDSKGLRCLAALLRRPGQFIQASELVVAANIQPLVPSPDAERLRVAVTKRIRAAIETVADCHPSLGHHLRTTVRTGATCAYLPDPSQAPGWTM